MYAPVDRGGLNMINVKNVVHVLRVKWMDRLCKDAGSSWSRFAWAHLTNILAPKMITSLTGIDENTLSSLLKFYRAVVYSYCYVNCLFYTKNQGLPLSYNLFGTKNHPLIRMKRLHLGLCTAFDLPL